MKVTDEMVERAMAVSVGGRVLIRNILEAALADVPEPGAVDFAVEASTHIISLRERIAELEAKLDKVRAYLSESPTVLRGQLLDILDGKEQP